MNICILKVVLNWQILESYQNLHGAVVMDFDAPLLAGIVWEVLTLAKLAWIERKAIFQNFGPLLVVIFAFVAFVFYNGSIVVGKLQLSFMQNICKQMLEQLHYFQYLYTLHVHSKVTYLLTRRGKRCTQGFSSLLAALLLRTSSSCSHGSCSLRPSSCLSCWSPTSKATHVGFRTRGFKLSIPLRSLFQVGWLLPQTNFFFDLIWGCMLIQRFAWEVIAC